MIKYVTVTAAALIAGMAFAGSSNEASAGCRSCARPAPIYHYRTVNRFMNRTQYQDVRRTNYVHQTRPIYNITRVRPIVQIHTVTRVHHYTVPVVRDVNMYAVRNLPAQYVRTNSVQNYYHGCGC